MAVLLQGPNQTLEMVESESSSGFVWTFEAVWRMATFLSEKTSTATTFSGLSDTPSIEIAPAILDLHRKEVLVNW
jgi:hypothetical protein